MDDLHPDEDVQLENEESLDPKDWEAMRVLGHRMIEDMMSYLESVRERPVWQPIPASVKQKLSIPLPLNPQKPEDIYQEFLDYILPHPMGNIHPRFWGWVIGTGTALGMLAELLAAGMNPNVGGADHVANYVERQVLEWCKEMLGYPMEASGLLVSGGSMANLVGLTVARNTMSGFDIRREGLGAAQKPMTFYGSVETHSSNQKAVELLGLGSAALRQIPVNAEFQIVLPALEVTVSKDRDDGFHPICVIGNAGTVNTGAIDDLRALADFSEREGLWFHIDGAFGALAALSPELRPLLSGLERADSLAFDLHKWMYMPYEIGCVLVRNEANHRCAFLMSADYLTHAERGLAGGPLWFSEYGPQLSRGFRALKAWMSIKEHGIKKYGRLIKQNVDQARYLTYLVDNAPQLERMAPVSLNIVCFRFKGGSSDDVDLNSINQEILIRLHEQGIAAPSYTTLSGNYALRVAITNHRSRREDFELLVRKVIRLGEDIFSERM
ncbi:MAG: aminotransferase class V-fold PLP-dependent enzyme [Dehalococcoidia bacterium]|nr:MAG: aminotransferase class V-fold PLP-dependent enzyme [Dehalococcoidia bacterium]